jgi:hypothetical protein
MEPSSSCRTTAARGPMLPVIPAGSDRDRRCASSPERKRGPQGARPIESNDPVLRSGIWHRPPGLRSERARPASRRRAPGSVRCSQHGGPTRLTWPYWPIRSRAHLVSLHESAVVKERDRYRLLPRPSFGRRQRAGWLGSGRRCSISHGSRMPAPASAIGLHARRMAAGVGRVALLFGLRRRGRWGVRHRGLSYRIRLDRPISSARHEKRRPTTCSRGRLGEE